MFKKIISILLLLSVLSSNVYAIPFDEYMSGRNQYKTASYIISPGLTYTEMLSETEKYGIQRSYIYEYVPSMGTTILPIYGDYVYGRDLLGSMIKQLETDGKRVVGGINGDFYIMSTGVSLSALIYDGEIITSDSGYTAMGFDKEGKAFISKPEMKISLSDSETMYEIGHINKTPNPYSIHLLTDKFASTTKSESESYEIVLAPYTDVEIIETEQEYNSILKETEEFLPEINVDKDAEIKEAHDNSEIFFITKKQIEQLETLTDEIADNEKSDSDEQPEDNLSVSETVHTQDSESDDTEKVDNTVEKHEYFAKKYTFSNEKLKVNSQIKTVITEIRRNSKDTSIPKGHFVLVADNLYFGDKVKDMSVGNEYTLSVQATEEWNDAVNAIGVYGGYILKDGEYCDDVEVDHYPQAHPRTAAGIKEDGTVVFFCVDGRQKSSGGMRIDELSHELKLLGCVEAVNLDGGGSTTAYATLPGYENSSIMNSPSAGTERKNANSLVFINTTEPENVATKYSFYPEKPYVVSGGSKYILPFPSATDDNFYPVPLSSDLEYEYFVDSEQTDSFIINKNEFVTGEIAGETDVYIRVTLNETEENENADDEPQIYECKAGTVYILDKPEKLDLTYKANDDDVENAIEDEVNISPFDQIKLNYKAEYHSEEIFYDRESFAVSLPKEEIYIEKLAEGDKTEVEQSNEPSSDKTTEEQSAENTESDTTNDEQDSEKVFHRISDGEILVSEKLTIDSELNIKPKIHGETIVVTTRLGKLEKTFSINIEKYPFNDSFMHWSSKNLFDMNKFGLMQGEPDGDERAFRPDRNFTKAEFFTVLARMLYPLIEEYEHPAADLQTDSESEIGATDETTIEDEEPITDALSEQQEQVQELTEQEIFAEMMLQNHEDLKIFYDYDQIPSWSRKYFEVVFQSGLLGFVAMYDEYGNLLLDPTEYITRREVLAVLGALCDEAVVDYISTFMDANTLDGDALYDFINNAVSTGIFEGYEDGTLRPQNLLTRAEAATALLRFINLERNM